MFKDIRYIFKRIIIGVGIALALMFIRGHLFIGVNAKEISSISVQGYHGAVDPVNGIAASVSFGGNYWVNWGSGYLYYNFSIMKDLSTGNTNVTPSVFVRSAYAVDGDNNTYICDIGSFSQINATFTQTVYSAKCPVYSGSSGLSGVQVRFFETLTCGQNGCGNSEVFINGNFTFEQADDVNVSVDTNGTTNAINNQITNDNSNTQSIISNQNQNTQDIKNTITNDSTTTANNTASGFFNNFSANSHGLSGVITAPLRLLNAFTTQSCTPLSFQLPFVHNNVVLPCMRNILETNYGFFFSLWQLITTGLISYNVCLNIYKKVRDLQNPKNDRIEVLNL